MQRTAFGRAWTAGMPAPFWVVRAELACATGPNPRHSDLRAWVRTGWRSIERSHTAAADISREIALVYTCMHVRHQLFLRVRIDGKQF